MKHHEFKSRRLDIQAFAIEGGQLEDQIAVTELTRLCADLHPQAGPEDVTAVRWRCRGEARARRAAAPEIWLHLSAEVVVPLECQRCLQPVAVPLAVDRWFRFVETEAIAAELDETSEDDVLVSSTAFDLQELIEDELLLALPVVPRHERCPDEAALHSALNPALGTAPQADDSESRPHPFAALAALRPSDDTDPSGGTQT